MAKKQDKRVASDQNQHEQECCELYGEYCYPCSVSESATPKKRTTRSTRQSLHK